MPETTVIPEQRVLHIPVTVKELIEALIFAAAEPLTFKQLKSIFDESEQAGERRSIDASEVETIVSTLNEEFQQAQKPYRVIKIAGGYQFATVVEYAEWVGKLYKEQGRRKLSQSSLETLAIIAYKQPITRPDIEVIRGVDCDYVLGTLLEKKLITITGRAPTPGRPLLYGTTESFLKHFGLNEISDLPKPREIEELLADSRYETERRMLEAQEQAEKGKKQEEDFKSRLPHIPKKKPEMDDSVEILHKKLSRELSVKKEESQDEKPVQATLETVDSSTPVTNNLEVEAPEVLEQSELQDPTENSSEDIIQDEIAHLPATTPLADDSRGLIHQTPATVSIEQDRAPDEAPQPMPEEQNQASVPQVEMTSTEEITDAGVEGSETVETASPQQEDIIETELNLTTSPVDEQPAAEIEMVTDLPVELNETQQVDVEPDIPEQEISETSITHEQQHATEEAPTESAPTVEVPPTPIPVAETAPPAMPPRVAPIVDQVRAPQPKTKWEQFKDTIRGFIKKVFG
ncbi:MAG TPA: SMC-Scp complex subunit ScpB [Bacteroidota bacterium]